MKNFQEINFQIYNAGGGNQWGILQVEMFDTGKSLWAACDFEDTMLFTVDPTEEHPDVIDMADVTLIDIPVQKLQTMYDSQDVYEQILYNCLQKYISGMLYY